MPEEMTVAEKARVQNPNASGVGMTEIKKAAGVLLGAWALKRFPKTAIFGLIGVGVLLGLTIKEVAKRVEQSPRMKDHLH